MGHIEGGFRRPGIVAHLVIGGYLVGGELGQGAHLAVKLYLCGGYELFVFAHKPVLLLHEGDKLRGKALQEYVDIGKHHLPEALLQLLSERAFGNSLCHPLGYLRHKGVALIVEVVLCAVEFVLGVDAVADVAEIVHGGIACGYIVPFKVGTLCVICGQSLFYLLCRSFRLHLQGIYIRACVLHFRKFHIYRSFFWIV